LKAPVFSTFLLLVIFGGLVSAQSMPSGLAMTFQSANGSVASDASKPSIPEFTVNLVDSSYETEPTATIDPYTGQTLTHPSQHIEARTIEIRIENTPFASSHLQGEDNKTCNTGFFYNIRWKPHFAPEKDWLSLFGYDQYLPRSSAAETIYPINMSLTWDGRIEVPAWSLYMPAHSQLDFQVQAIIGGPNNAWSFSGETSDWSSTQILSIGDNSPTPTTSPSEATNDLSCSPLVPSVTPVQSNVQSGILFGLDLEQAAIVVLGIAVALLAFGLVISRKKKRK
jgi:LPXTG-motif cell wall-anchored protein